MFPFRFIYESRLCNVLLKAVCSYSWCWKLDNITLPTTAAPRYQPLPPLVTKIVILVPFTCAPTSRHPTTSFKSLSTSPSSNPVHLSSCHVFIDGLRCGAAFRTSSNQQCFCEFVKFNYHSNFPHFCGDFLCIRYVKLCFAQCYL